MCSSFNIDLRLEPWLHGAAVLRCCLFWVFPVIFDSLNFDRILTECRIHFFRSLILYVSKSPFGAVFYSWQILEGSNRDGCRQIRVVSTKSIVTEGIFSPFVLASAV